MSVRCNSSSAGSSIRKSRPHDGLDYGMLKTGARSSFAKPIQRAKGIDTVIVNGAVVWREGKPTGARPGRVLARTA